MRKIFAALALMALPLAGCGSIFSSEEGTLTVAERHPITVDQQTVSIVIPVDPTLTGLSRGNLAELDAFLTAYRTRGHGPVTVTVPSGSDTDIDAQQTAANIRSALNSFGLRYEDMLGATYRTTERKGDVLVSFTRYVASGPECGVFTGEISSRLRNMPAPNFGCATQANFAAMVADPRDMTSSQAIAPSDGTRAAASVRSLRTGKNTRDNDNEVGVAVTDGNGE